MPLFLTPPFPPTQPIWSSIAAPCLIFTSKCRALIFPFCTDPIFGKCCAYIRLGCTLCASGSSLCTFAQLPHYLLARSRDVLFPVFLSPNRAGPASSPLHFRSFLVPRYLNYARRTCPRTLTDDRSTAPRPASFFFMIITQLPRPPL